MAFRSKTKIGAIISPSRHSRGARVQVLLTLCLILAIGAPLLAAEPLVYHVRHRHTRDGAPGVLRVGDQGIAFEETGKYAAHSRQWRFQDIEQLTLSPAILRILTYEDRPWKLGDREFVFDRLPEDFAAQLYPVFSRRLDQRFVAALADDSIKPEWDVPVKLLHWAGGAQGTLLVGSERVVFKTASPDQSRTWRLGDIDKIGSSGPFDLTVTTFERDGANYAGRRDFHFELKQPMAESDYDALWRKLNRSKREPPDRDRSERSQEPRSGSMAVIAQ